jgi:N-acetylglucosaminyl-diphospho-decaprenol L-rhamnosyltransferase
MTEPSVGIVIVNYGSSAMLMDCVGGRLWRWPTTVVVVDNFSGAVERESIRELCQEQGWQLVMESNVGFGRGVNVGVKHARSRGCDVIVLLNPDAVASADAVEALAEQAWRDRNVVVGPTIVRENGEVWFSGGSLNERTGMTSTRPGSDSSARGGWLTGACLAIRADLWENVGGFDDRYFLYWEDIDLSFRCTNAGARLVVRDDIRIVHAVGATQGFGKSATYVYFNCRNRLLFATQHLGFLTKLRWLARSGSYAKRVVLRSGRRHFLRNAPRLIWAAAAGTARGAFSSRRSIPLYSSDT